MIENTSVEVQLKKESLSVFFGHQSLGTQTGAVYGSPKQPGTSLTKGDLF